MSWLGKFFKNGASSSDSSGLQQPRVLEEETTVRHAPYISSFDDHSRFRREIEELDRAIAMSLSEGFKRPTGQRRQMETDEDLARSLHSRLNFEPSPPPLPFPSYAPREPPPPPPSPPFPSYAPREPPPFPSYAPREPPPPFPSYAPRKPPPPPFPSYAPRKPPSPPYPSYAPRERYPRANRIICDGCKLEIPDGNYLGYMGTFFHPKCFQCHSCGYPITEREFSLSGKDAYHKSCFKDLTHPKCEVCHQYIPTNRAGLIEFRCHPFWSQKYCPSHEYDRTPRCSSCERLESRDNKYVSLGDGRSLCLECLESSIMDTGECQPLYRAILDFYGGLNMRITQEITMLLVERHALNDAIEGEKHGLHHMPETRGLCLSEEQTVTSVRTSVPNMDRCGLVGIRTQPQRLIRQQRCEITAILVLFGLPRLLTGAILAHELMHAWLRLNDFRNLKPEVEEGICQVLAHMWLESEVIPTSRNMSSASSSVHSPFTSRKGGKSRFEKKLGMFFLHQIENDSSPAYGGGYKAGIAAVNKYGLRHTLDHIHNKKTFPDY